MFVWLLRERCCWYIHVLVKKRLVPKQKRSAEFYRKRFKIRFKLHLLECALYKMQPNVCNVVCFETCIIPLPKKSSLYNLYRYKKLEMVGYDVRERLSYFSRVLLVLFNLLDLILLQIGFKVQINSSACYLE